MEENEELEVKDNKEKKELLLKKKKISTLMKLAIIFTLFL